MSEERTFTQAEVEKIVEERLARAREKFAKESESLAETEELRQQLEAKEAEIAQIRQEHYREGARRAVVAELGAHGVVEEGRIERILRYVDVDALERADDGNPRLSSIRGQLADVSRDMPELLDFRLGTGSGGPGSKKPVLSREKPLSREEVEKMSESEINSNWQRVRGFLAGERS